jgi:predicted peptidase
MIASDVFWRIAERRWRCTDLRLWSSIVVVTVARVASLHAETAVPVQIPHNIPTETFTRLFATLEIEEVSAHNRRHQAFLFEPRPTANGQRYPLIIWLHGGYGYQDMYEFNELYGPLNWLPTLLIQDASRPEQYPFFVLVPKCSREMSSWFANTDEINDSNDMLTVVKTFIDRVIEEYPIDRERISVAGISSGGAASWELAARYPDIFSVVVPLSSGCYSTDRVNRLVDTPVWTFVNEWDNEVATSARSAVRTLNEAGGTAHVTVFPQSGHDAWSGAFLDHYDLLAWMTTKRKDDPSWYLPPGCRTSEWMWDNLGMASARLACLAVIILCVSACWREFVRRRHLTAQHTL